MKKLLAVFTLSFITILTAQIGATVVNASELNLYSYRQPFLIQPLMDAYTNKSGVKVNIVYAKKGMLERIKAEGANSPADLVLTVDMNISGAGVLKSSKNKESALKLVEYLASPEAQAIYAHQNFEYPVVKGVSVDGITDKLGTFKPDTISLAEVAKYRSMASKLMDEVGFDN